VDAISFNVIGDTQISARVPVGLPPGPTSITVSTSNGVSTFSNVFTVQPAAPGVPVVAQFAPAGGVPGTIVTITGIGFTGVTQVLFGTVAASNFTVSGDTTITVRVPYGITPAGSATVPITLVGAAGSGVSATPFAAAPPPAMLAVLSTISPVSAAPGATVTLTGSYFSGASLVTFGGVAAPTFTVQDDQTLTVLVPAGAASGPIQVVTAAGLGTSTASFTVLPPTAGITGFTPATGAADDTVTIDGAGFTGATQVNFGSVASTTISVTSDSQIAATVPAGAQTGPITLVVPGGIYTSSTPFTVSGSSAPPAGLPTISGFTPSGGGPAATPVTLNGTGFLAVTQVTLGGVTVPAAAVTIASDTQVSFPVPPGAPTGPITVVTPAGIAQSPSAFTVPPPVPVPAGISLSATSGPTGSSVTISGTSLAGAILVAFNGFAAPFSQVDASTLTATVPATAPTGPVTVTVATLGGTASGGPFTITAPAPALSIAGYTPNSGPWYTAVQITGTGLGAVTQVTFNGVPSASFQVLDNGQLINAPVPMNAGTGTLAVVSPGGTLNLGPFTVAPPLAPAIIAMDPAQGIPGTEVLLTGQFFNNATQVAFGGAALAAGGFEVLDDTRIRLRIPDAVPPGTQALAVTTPVGTGAAGTDFTVLPSRLLAFLQPTATNVSPFGLNQVDFPAVRRTQQYQFLNYPQAPVLHAYNPLGGAPGSLLTNPFAHFTVNVQLPAPFFEILPASIRNQLNALGISPANVEVFLVSQDYAYDGISGADGIYELRPHYWLDPDVPEFGVVNDIFNIQVGLFEQETGITMGLDPATPAPAPFFAAGVTVHGPADAASNPVYGQVLSSPNNLPVYGINAPGAAPGTSPPDSHAFWSLVVDTNKAAATLHLLLNDADQAALQGAVNGLPANAALGQLGLTLATLFPAASPIPVKLEELTRPLVTGAARVSLSSSQDELTVTGSMLSAATDITLGGVAVNTFTTQSDAVLRFVVPAGTSGVLVIEGPIGDSLPFPVP
jgi:hypothetical protein